MRYPRYLDPRNYVTFVKIFGKHKHILKSFLNELLPIEYPICDLEYLRKEELPNIPLLKDSIINVRCANEKEQQYIVQITINYTPEFHNKVVYTQASTIVNPLMLEDDIYVLSLVDAICYEETDDYIHHFELSQRSNVSNSFHASKSLEFIFIELPKFSKTCSESDTKKQLWLRFMTEMCETTVKPLSDLIQISELSEAMALLEPREYSENELYAYDRNWDAVRDVRMFWYDAKIKRKATTIIIPAQ